MTQTAEDLAKVLESKDTVADVQIVSQTAVAATRVCNINHQILTFHGAAEKGWRVAIYDRKETGDLVVFTPIDPEDVIE